jgi:opacity protein-like surface antigen
MQKLRFRLCVVFMALIVNCVPLLSQAQQTSGSAGGHSAGLQFGQVWPAGLIGEGVDGSIAPGLFYEFAASQIFAMQVNLVRSSHNDKLTLFSSSAGIRANLTFFDRLVPYASAGVGLYFVERNLGAPNNNVETTNFGLNLGLGADLDLNESFFMGLSLGLHNLFSAKTKTAAGIERENSGRWSALFIRAGMRF